MTSEERKARRLAIAQSRAERTRSQLVGTMSEIQARLHPRALLQEATSALRTQALRAADEALQAARDRPALIVALASVLALILARRPMLRAILNLFGHDEEPTAPKGGSDSIIGKE